MTNDNGKIVCNMCGKDFSETDTYLAFGMHNNIGYGSKHDGDVMNLDLCCDCTDKFIAKLSECCKIAPLIEFE